jgi:hypothetical protein
MRITTQPPGITARSIAEHRAAMAFWDTSLPWPYLCDAEPIEEPHNTPWDLFEPPAYLPRSLPYIGPLIGIAYGVARHYKLFGGHL